MTRMVDFIRVPIRCRHSQWGWLSPHIQLGRTSTTRTLGSGGGVASPAAPGDPVAEVRLAQLAARDSADHAVGLVWITGRRKPDSAVPLDELNGGEERASLVAVGQGDGS